MGRPWLVGSLRRPAHVDDDVLDRARARVRIERGDPTCHVARPPLHDPVHRRVYRRRLTEAVRRVGRSDHPGPRRRSRLQDGSARPVTDLEARLADPLPKPVGCGEVLRRPGILSLLEEVANLGRDPGFGLAHSGSASTTGSAIVV